MAKRATYTVTEFIEAMGQEATAIKRRIMRLQYEIAEEIRWTAMDNVKKIFGRGQGSTARTAGRGGDLMKSIQIESNGPGKLAVVAGGPGVPYAAIHEYGGVIEPVNTNWLTIPVAEPYFGRRAKEFKLQFRSTFKSDKYDNPIAWLVDREGGAAYLLSKHVEMPARPYMQPAVEKVKNDAVIAEKIKKVFDGDNPLDIEVRVK